MDSNTFKLLFRFVPPPSRVERFLETPLSPAILAGFLLFLFILVGIRGNCHSLTNQFGAYVPTIANDSANGSSEFVVLFDLNRNEFPADFLNKSTFDSSTIVEPTTMLFCDLVMFRSVNTRNTNL